MRDLIALFFLVALLGCNQEKGGAPSKEKADRSVGMSEEIWRIYSGAESGLPEEKRGLDEEKSKKKK